MANTFAGERLPTSTDPKRQAVRDYMLAYMRTYRARRRAGAPVAVVGAVQGSADQVRQSQAASIAAMARRARRGYCAVCGHRSPDPSCPVCVNESLGERVDEDSPAWGALIGLI